MFFFFKNISTLNSHAMFGFLFLKEIVVCNLFTPHAMFGFLIEIVVLNLTPKGSKLFFSPLIAKVIRSISGEMSPGRIELLVESWPNFAFSKCWGRTKLRPVEGRPCGGTGLLSLFSSRKLWLPWPELEAAFCADSPSNAREDIPEAVETATQRKKILLTLYCLNSSFFRSFSGLRLR